MFTLSEKVAKFWRDVKSELEMDEQRIAYRLSEYGILDENDINVLGNVPIGPFRNELIFNRVKKSVNNGTEQGKRFQSFLRRYQNLSHRWYDLSKKYFIS